MLPRPALPNVSWPLLGICSVWAALPTGLAEVGSPRCGWRWGSAAAPCRMSPLPAGRGGHIIRPIWDGECAGWGRGGGRGRGGRGGGREGQGNTFIYLLLEEIFALLGFPDLGVWLWVLVRVQTMSSLRARGQDWCCEGQLGGSAGLLRTNSSEEKQEGRSEGLQQSPRPGREGSMWSCRRRPPAVSFRHVQKYPKQTNPRAAELMQNSTLSTWTWGWLPLIINRSIASLEKPAFLSEERLRNGLDLPILINCCFHFNFRI